MPKNATARARRYALTFYTKPDISALQEKQEIRYFIMGEEICPETKRTHWQSYIELNKVMRVAALKTLLNDNTVHVERCKGSPEDNIRYCSKDGKVEQFGESKKQGQRTDVEALYTHFKEGKKLGDALDEGIHLSTIARHPKFVNMLELHFTPPRTEKTELHIYWGPTHTGKSHTAFEEAKKLGEVYFKPVDSNWWDGYDGQPCVILEDFRGEISLATMLRLADKYPMRVPVKGGYKQFNSKRIYVTSNIDVDEWFNTSQKGYDASIAAFKRRITVKKHFSEFFEIKK